MNFNQSLRLLALGLGGLTLPCFTRLDTSGVGRENTTSIWVQTFTRLRTESEPRSKGNIVTEVRTVTAPLRTRARHLRQRLRQRLQRLSSFCINYNVRDRISVWLQELWWHIRFADEEGRVRSMSLFLPPDTSGVFASTPLVSGPTIATGPTITTNYLHGPPTLRGLGEAWGQPNAIGPGYINFGRRSTRLPSGSATSPGRGLLHFDTRPGTRLGGTLLLSPTPTAVGFGNSLRHADSLRIFASRY